MGAFVALGPCCACGRIFGFSPTKVPSVTVEGQREPICEDCVARANPVRTANGLDPIRPLPGAYEPGEDGDGELL